MKIGLKLISEQRLGDAVRSFDNALKVNPANINAYYYKGKCLIWLNHGDEGIKCFDMVFELKSREIASVNIFDSISNKEPESNNAINKTEIENEFTDIMQDRTTINHRKGRLIYDQSSQIKEEDVPKKSMVVDFKNKFYSMFGSDNSNDQISNYGKHLPLTSSEHPIENQITKDKLVKNKVQIELDPYDLSQHKYQFDTIDSEIMPQDGGVQKADAEFMIDLLKYQRRQIDDAICYLMDKHGGGFYYYVNPQYLFKLGIFLLQTIIDEYHMDGVVISVDKPAKYIQKILKNSCSSKYQPFYIDCNAADSVSNNLEFELENDDLNATRSNVIDKITYLESNIKFPKLNDAIEMNLQNIAELYEGENHFLFFDNIAGFQNYTSDREIKKFIKSLEINLRKLHLFGFFMVPKGFFNISLLDSIQNFSASITNKFHLENK